MDLIIYNGYICTMDVNNPIVSALGVKDGLVACVGSDHEVLSHKEPGTHMVDAHGRCIIPGFNDSHMHLLNYAASRSGVELSEARSVSDIAELVRQYIENNRIPAGEPVMGRGWNQNLFDIKAFPTRHDLDNVSPLNPVCLWRACGHVAAVNSLSLAKAGIRADTINPEGGEIHRDADGSPNGVLTENAIDLVKLYDKQMTVEQIKDMILKTTSELAKKGITSVQTDDFTHTARPSEVCAAYTELAAEGKLSVRVTEQRRANTLNDCHDILALEQPPQSLREYFKLGPVKLMADGSLGARTAYMLEDYHDDSGNRGVAVYTKEELQAIVDLVHDAGESLAIHAIGDGAVAMALDCIEEARNRAVTSARHGVVHAQITSPDLLRCFAELEVMAYIQPVFIHEDARIAAARVGAKKALSSYAFKTLRDSGVRIPIGTDCPVESFDPFPNLFCAVTRSTLPVISKDNEKPPAISLNPDEALTMSEAVSAYTADSAYASFDEHNKGLLKPGQYADLIMLSRNIFCLKPEELLKTEVVMTVLGGKIIYEMD